MEIFPLPTPILAPGDDLAGALLSALDFYDDDIVCVSSKALATVEGAHIDLSRLTISAEARAWDERLHLTESDPAFWQAVLDETERLHGRALPGCPHVILTELKPAGFSIGTLLVPNAGLDRSNTQPGTAIGWPHDPVASTRLLRSRLQERSGRRLAVILTDSGCQPRRIGVTAIALTVSGLDPFFSRIGQPDLFGHHFHMTQEAIADQLATAANFLMGNGTERQPAAVIRGHGLPLSDFVGWVPGIEPEEDLFRGAL